VKNASVQLAFGADGKSAAADTQRRLDDEWKKIKDVLKLKKNQKLF
jgi:hypothetical protein